MGDAASVERSIASLAASQNGVVTTEQLIAAGLTRATIKRRLRSGRLHGLHRGVYLLGHHAAPEGATEMAAILACGPGSLISHRSAARLRNLSAFKDWDGPIEVTVPGRRVRHRPGIRVFKVDSLDRRDVVRIRGIPTTSTARTLLDLAGVIPFHELEDFFAEARARGLVREHQVRALLGRSFGRRGVPILRRLMELQRDRGLTRSAAERRLVKLVEAAELPAPKTNVWLCGVCVDTVWPNERVVVEVDGFAYHSDREMFEADRARDAKLGSAGYLVTRVTWRQLVTRPEAVIARIAAMLAVRSVPQRNRTTGAAV